MNHLILAALFARLGSFNAFGVN